MSCLKGIKLFYCFDRIHDFGFQLVHQFGIVFKKAFDCVATLSEFGVAIAKPGTAFFDDLIVDPKIDDLAYFGNSKER